jgi:hypothetical protein
MPIMWDGNGFSNSSGGIRNPEALVRIVNARKIAVRHWYPPRAEHSEHNDQARHDCNQADDHVDHRERHQAHTQYHDAPS